MFERESSGKVAVCQVGENIFPRSEPLPTNARPLHTFVCAHTREPPPVILSLAHTHTQPFHLFLFSLCSLLPPTTTTLLCEPFSSAQSSHHGSPELLEDLQGPPSPVRVGTIVRGITTRTGASLRPLSAELVSRHVVDEFVGLTFGLPLGTRS